MNKGPEMNLSCHEILGDTSKGYFIGSLASHILVTLALAAMTTVTFVSNSVLVSALTLTRTRPPTTTMCLTLILSLVWADLLLSVTVMPISLYNLAGEIWSLGATFCRIFNATDIMLCTVSILHLSGLALDRYLAVCRPFLHHRLGNTSARAMCVFCWVLSALVALPMLVPEWLSKDPVARCLHHAVEHGGSCVVVAHPVYQAVVIPAVFFLPLLFITGFHVRIFCAVRARARERRRTIWTTPSASSFRQFSRSTFRADSGDSSSDDANTSSRTRNGTEMSSMSKSKCSDHCVTFSSHGVAISHEEVCLACGEVSLLSAKRLGESLVNLNSRRTSLVFHRHEDCEAQCNANVRSNAAENNTLDSTNTPEAQNLQELSRNPEEGRQHTIEESLASNGSQETSYGSQQRRNRRETTEESSTEGKPQEESAEPGNSKQEKKLGEQELTAEILPEDQVQITSEGRLNEDSTQGENTRASDPELGGEGERQTLEELGGKQDEPADLREIDINRRNGTTSLNEHYVKRQQPKESAADKKLQRSNQNTGTPTERRLEDRNPDNKRPKGDKAMKAVLCLVLCFVVCWLPIFVVLLMVDVGGYDVPRFLLTVFTWLGYFSSTLNPFLNYRYNTTIRNSVRCLFRRRRVS
ncbi:hypothetical protein BaRGS_00012017 [Batillaria attramentaria]|uniref:G-protein coupled receptors family 1 profile domain-containing protein n=1 Tax=Batillaria attramentaria TaxID=370345 RepID=A0ABD0LBN8_9CAEN